jgi:hypothetical protein
MIFIGGVDTQHHGFYVKSFGLTKEEWKELELFKGLARESGMFRSDGIPLTFRGFNFRILAKGAKTYSYILVSDDMTVKLAKRPSNKMFPEVFVEFRSQLLWRYGHVEAFRFVSNWIRSWAWGFDDVISRGDLCVDLSGQHQVEIEHVVSRARKVKEYFEVEPVTNMEHYYFNKKRTGITIGSGNCLMRIYDKTVEVKKSDKGWFHDLWKEKGWDGESTVTRVEFQLRREFFKSFGITTYEQFLEKMGDIYSYLADDWISVRKPNDDVNRSRWPVSELWQDVQGGSSQFGVKHGNLTKRQINEAKLERLLPQAVGSYTSAISLMKTGNNEEFAEAASRLLAKKGTTLEEAVEAKRKLRGMLGSPDSD